MKLAFFLALSLFSVTCFALDVPNGKVVLAVSGALSQQNSGKNAEFSMDMLTKLPQHSFVSKTPWYEKPVKFTGPLLRDVLAAAGAKGVQISALALDDYRVEIPFQDAIKYPIIIARLLDDKPMAVRDKGPLFIVYPFDQYKELHQDIYYTRSVWQLSKIIVQ
ncbi:molybdopterin-dependent oxidoreductase [Iodobacter fluviatilis]|uniref:Oxidoreductase molybdopterin binding domain n=1 Tax=Iodobacter fluviatilis TaxID=537 RepID=A0A377Q934_9NEIS|nr:molybdopterin-dependent oxidoreductase [Iodobacter fluviatilis]TCU88506.1 hypothetical protein EV682_10389 [Iodobacter fluviatilis]STQ91423.1 Oxidoreductase molybdopterin binding domain [Iodobacter fluviatilis]